METIKIINFMDNASSGVYTLSLTFTIGSDEYKWYASESFDNEDEFIFRATRNGKELFKEYTKFLTKDEMGDTKLIITNSIGRCLSKEIAETIYIQLNCI